MMTQTTSAKNLVLGNAGIRLSGNVATPWWQAGGALGCLEAHQARGAASLAASYVNLVAPGTHDALPIVAPTWNAGSGWIFNGTTQYLVTDIVPLATYSMLVQFSSATLDNTHLCGETDAEVTFFLIIPRFADGNHYFGNGGLTPLSGKLSGGNLAVIGSKGYRDGVFEGDIAAGSVPAFPIYLGCRNRGGAPFDFFTGDVQAYALYDRVLTATQVLEVAAAMANLQVSGTKWENVGAAWETDSASWESL